MRALTWQGRHDVRVETVPDPEIVNREPDALDAEAGQRIHQLDKRLRRALGQLQHKPVGRDVERPAHPFDQIGKIQLIEAQRRNIEGEAGVEALLDPA